ncbi:formylglycine-generating enzyme family protein [Chamaesiphon sp. VAR_69_metabat_338]|uniref:formylglycine-generating enzyme family protein n=1 Tax=Chamaesiphon sp. VAR_69_metabat_338 TaxID=2964704 RepID=UPI00286E01E0|nr:formylglycine-generating enzyme family protein [Chamaesiphon sp. VAR_69_metabat_338]
MSSVPNLQTCTFENVRVDGCGEIVDRQTGRAEYFTVSLADGVTLDLVAIPGGEFMMGDDLHHPDERPVHRVTVPSFFMSKYPITQAQYRSIMGADAGFGLGAAYPIERVSWDEAIEFCTRLSQKLGDRYTLPSEAQWEYACRAGTQTAFHFGETITPEVVNYNGDFPYAGAPTGENRARATPVGSFPPNQFGLYDMHGNVWEWCADEYRPSYHDAPIDGSAWTTGAVPNDVKRVMRGGAWDYVAKGCRSAVRGSLAPGSRMAGCGFRVVFRR